MRFNRVGKTDIQLSSVGFGTCQLRLVPERQAIDTLKRGFELGVNWVHTAPDYGGTEELIARAIEESGKEIKVLSNGFGEMSHFKHLFENTCRIFKKDRMEMYGISCVDDHEILGHNVWEKGGMIDFLLEKKEEGRIGSLFCTTHGNPEYIERLVTCGHFDAVMLSYNPLGFHVLSYYGKAEGKEFEDIDRTCEKIFPLAMEREVSLLIMKPLAGGMLCRSKAFPPHKRFSEERDELSASDVLRAILREPAVCAVVPGTASLDEAEENARAGHEPIEIPEERLKIIDDTVADMKAALCSRCGECEDTCSKSLRISWLFREGYIWNYPSDTFEALSRLHYFDLHPDKRLVCETCQDRTCRCPYGVDIPASLARIHGQMLSL
ncbi:MAG: aldo/keto reductase, partial [Planctomycetota bacterium]